MIRYVNGVFQFLLENSLFLILGALVGLVWANAYPLHYMEFKHVGEFFVNDIAMCFFFALAAKEIWESFLPGGALSTPRKAAMPLLATIGGMTGPALIFIAGAVLFKAPALMQGWAIPCATDIAFSYMIARFVFGANHPAIPFLLLLAIADDALGLLVLAVFYPTGEGNVLLFLAITTAAVIIGLLMRKRGVRSFWPYVLVPGGLSWLGFYLGGIHPALALVPIIPTLPHAHHDTGLFAETDELPTPTLDALEEWWKHPVEVILFAFGFMNGGVTFSSIGFPTALVLAALMLGKPIGIFLFSSLGKMFGLSLPENMGNKELVVLGVCAGIGFTVALFVSTVAFPGGSIQDAAKMGALLSGASGAVAIIAARMLNIKKRI